MVHISSYIYIFSVYIHGYIYIHKSPVWQMKFERFIPARSPSVGKTCKRFLPHWQGGNQKMREHSTETARMGP